MFPQGKTGLASDETHVLVIYTGGTIGMLLGNRGSYVPEPYFLTETLKSQTRFHDPMQDSLFSNSSSVQGFRQFLSGSGRSSPSQSPTTSQFPQPTLLVRSSRPIGSSATLDVNKNDRPPPPTCVQVAENVYEAHLPSLITPRTSVSGSSGSKSIRYAILEWNPLLDSSNIETEDWIRLASEIELNYSFDAFVILHGTDTMSYTSSALSFLLEDLGKTVILTGAQIPLSQLRNDAVDNLMGALTIAGNYIIPETTLYFNHTLFRGNRVSKMSSYDLSAFDSPNFAPLVKVGIDIHVNWSDVLRQTSLRRFRAHKEMSPHVATLRLFPGITTATVRAFLSPPVRGVVLESFGSGNAPQRADLLFAFKEACDRGVIVVAISQCIKGSVSDAYEAGRELSAAGVIAGSDMTPECALTKLSYLLSKPEFSVEDVRKLIGTPLRGELTRASAATLAEETLQQNSENIQGLLSEFVRITSRPSSAPTPQITISLPDGATQDAAASWTSTVSEAVSTEGALLPFLIHAAAARNDTEALKFCIKAEHDNEMISTPGPLHVASGLVNALDPSWGGSPLHAASANGAIESVDILLHSGALVHLRDTLGHTALYYAARQGHENVVDMLIQAGARLSGSDGTFAQLAVRTATENGDVVSSNIWAKAGVPRESISM
ncbi:L-asparaginase [Mycena indigotica]|uniref:asparaginase n=1 Tax=Mycena indigotica TaxID=2126181 RepID=A0A8H6VYX3_9AGAR|nr:L-asparaginase [Mycena indigotica]KAF7295368.1 L-asparaginase [Mycena indigotica]